MTYLGLLLFFVFEYVRIGNYVPGVTALHLNSLIPLSVFTATVFGRGPVSNGDVLKEQNTMLLLLLLGLVAASVAVAAVTMNTLEVFITVLGYTLIYYVIAKQATTLSRIKGIFKVLVGVHLALIALTPQLLTSPDTRHYVASGTFLGDGNDFALSVVMVTPLVLFLLAEAKSITGKTLAAGALILLILAVISTQSRGGTIALGMVALYYWWKSPRKLVTGTGAVIALVAAIAFAPPQYFQRMNSIADYETDGSAQGRITAWRAGTRMMLSNPLMGVGAGQFIVNYTRFTPGEQRWKTAHSIYFLILGELGLPGFLLLIYVIVRNLTVNRRLSKALRARGQPATAPAVRLLACLSASMLAYAIAGAFLSATYYPHMFVFAGLMTAAQRLTLAEQSAPAKVAQPSPGITAARIHGLPASSRQRGRERLITDHGRFF